ncbi:hypothetical protein DBV15_03762 [Temnothorax longispinosus]|uniref:Uncharacterized protein n=1 Tax=Temnothorax longispinosus TaxID=300112 RepID=A0A4S2KQU3_9HYME|nr:hypothetical protein DBV15_03762 [Temnothorax longispinosus]
MILMIDNLQYTLPLLITALKVFIMWHKKEDGKFACANTESGEGSEFQSGFKVQCERPHPLNQVLTMSRKCLRVMFKHGLDWT